MVDLDPAGLHVFDAEVDFDIRQAGGENPVAWQTGVAGIEDLDHHLDIVWAEKRDC